MNRKLNRVLDEIQKTEKKMAEWQAHLQELNEQRERLEDTEILKCIRSTKLQGYELMEFLAKLQEDYEAARKDAVEPEKKPEAGKNRKVASKERTPEREDTGDEKNV